VRNNLENYNVSLWVVIAAGAAILLSCGCASSVKDTYGAYKISSTSDTALPTNKIKLYFLPHYTEVKNNSPEWKIYEELIGDSIKFLAEQKDCTAANAGYIGKEALGKDNIFMDILSLVNPAAIARDIRGSELEWQEKAAMNFVNKEFPQNNKEDSLILCLYVRPQYPCKMAGAVIPYPRPGAVPVSSAGISQLELGYLLVDPAEKTIAKRRKVILTRSVETEVDPQAKDEHWKFGEDQSAFLEKAVARLLNEFPLMNRRLARRLPDEPLVPISPAAAPLSVASITQPEDVYTRLAQWRAGEKGCQVTIELADGPQWVVTIGLKGTGAEKFGLNFNSNTTEDDWVNCAVKDGFFHGRGGKAGLEPILKTFLNWVDNPDKNHHNN
jgi:Immunity protein 53